MSPAKLCATPNTINAPRIIERFTVSHEFVTVDHWFGQSGCSLAGLPKADFPTRQTGMIDRIEHFHELDRLD